MGGVEDLERGVGERHNRQREVDVGLVDAVAPAAVHGHVGGQLSRRTIRPAEVVSLGRIKVSLF